MARVSTHVKSARETKREYRCGARECKSESRTILPGQKYYQWALRAPGSASGTVYRQHTECGWPRPSQLSRRKTAVIEDAIMDAEEAIGGWHVDLCDDPDTEELSSILADVASTASEVGQEYQDGFDNMPDGLQQGETGQAMEAIAGELEDWSSELESWSPDTEEPSWPDRDDHETDEEYEEARESAFDDWLEQVKSEATDALSNMPEYQG